MGRIHVHYRAKHYLPGDELKTQEMFIIADVSTTGYTDCTPQAALRGAADALFDSLVNAVENLDASQGYDVDGEVDPEGDEGIPTP